MTTRALMPCECSMRAMRVAYCSSSPTSASALIMRSMRSWEEPGRELIVSSLE